ncbi:MAG: hypothetical protein R2854_17490 [Caldilineaceae bacterium]
MLDANSRVLAELEHAIRGYVDRDSKVDHLVTVESGAEIINSVIRGPAIIGEDSRIVNSYVGPFTSIYHDTLVEDSEIEHSIVLDHFRALWAFPTASKTASSAGTWRSPTVPSSRKPTR